MTIFVVGLVCAGVALALAAGIGQWDAAGLGMLAAILLLGGLGVAVARRAGTDAVAPARCPVCEGLLSPHAPYCKHCGAPIASGRN